MSIVRLPPLGYDEYMLKKAAAIGYGLLAIVFGGLLGWYVLTQVNLGEAVRAAQRANLWEVGGAMLLAPISGIFRAYRWRLLLSAKVAVHRLFLVEQVGISVNQLSFLRFFFDEAVRVGILAGKDDVDAGPVLASEAMQRTLELGGTALIVGAGVAFVPQLRTYWVPASAAVGVAIMSLVLLFTVGPRVADFKLVRRFKFVRQFADSAGAMRQRWQRSLAAFGLSLASTITLGIAGWLMARALGIDIGVFAIVSVSEAIRFIVSFVPGLPFGFGTLDAVTIGVLKLWGVPADVALTFALGLRFVWYLPSFLFAFGFLLSEGLFSVRAIKELSKKQWAAAGNSKNEG